MDALICPLRVEADILPEEYAFGRIAMRNQRLRLALTITIAAFMIPEAFAGWTNVLLTEDGEAIGMVIASTAVSLMLFLLYKLYRTDSGAQETWRRSPLL